ncbi:MAG TPA: Bcr/CflA family multidrug efflux MFS transporter [Pyrinomonadaceae bacterium]|jgi:DHA1 family bicyclomycin/chloramphenicol resistance-like MFS transporter
MSNSRETYPAEIKSPPKSKPLALLIVILAGLTAFAPLSIDMYLPSFPQIAADFGVPVARVELSLATFFVGLAFGQLLYGTATDRFGRKKPLYVGLTIYFVSSVLCAFAPNVESLIVFRFFQALGACGGIVIARATVRDLFDHRESARVFSLLMLVMGVAPILAPLLGGYVALYFGWHAIFGVVSLVSAVCLAAVYRFLPETKEPNPHIRLGEAFAIYLGVLKDRRFLAFTLAGGLAQAGMFAYITGSPFVFIELFGVPAEKYGWIFGSNAVGMIAVSQVNGRLVSRYNPTRILRACLFVTAAFGLLLIAAGVLNFGFWGVLIPIFLYIASLGMIFPNATAGALSEQTENAGSASALIGSLQYTLAAIASSLVSHFSNGTTLPMTALVGVCGVAAFLALYLLIGAGRERKFVVSEEHATFG